MDATINSEYPNYKIQLKKPGKADVIFAKFSAKQERDCWGVGFGGIWRGRRESVRKI